MVGTWREKRITVDLEDKLYNRVTIRCAGDGRRITGLVRWLLVESLEKEKEEFQVERPEGSENSPQAVTNNHRSRRAKMAKTKIATKLEINQTCQSRSSTTALA